MQFPGDPASKSTTINWKEGKGPKNPDQDVEDKTFFTWFTDNSDPSGDEIAEVPRICSVLSQLISHNFVQLHCMVYLAMFNIYLLYVDILGI